jgi:hypothetical protein
MIGLLKGLTDWISAGSLSTVEVGCKEVPTDMDAFRLRQCGAPGRFRTKTKAPPRQGGASRGV